MPTKSRIPESRITQSRTTESRTTGSRLPERAEADYIEADRIEQSRLQKNEGGSSLGSRAPKGRVPLIRPRRDRIMGSSILASLSEAGGNDPFHLVSRPLPPHLLDVADRVGTRPTPLLVQLDCPFLHLSNFSALLSFQHVSHPKLLVFRPDEADSGIVAPDWHGPSLFPHLSAQSRLGPRAPADLARSCARAKIIVSSARRRVGCASLRSTSQSPLRIPRSNSIDRFRAFPSIQGGCPS